MTDTFTWKPETNPTGTSTLRVRTAQFGDGYSQEVPDGINNETQSWPLTFAGTKDELQPIADFFRAHNGCIGFYWTPPLGVQGLYKAPSFTMNENAGIYTITVSFQQKFAP
ncbi:phage tail protein [Dyella sp.]|uniref:phage tail protein n=1 Tax=Dyella sp. TaxID=1869338 RepID=UPI002845631F|nr:phage tail protein [Dyella sp.]MDR3446011.1 phage tail protein [Dyella sp.]